VVATIRVCLQLRIIPVRPGESEAVTTGNNTDVKRRPDYAMVTPRLLNLTQSKAQELKLNSAGKKLALDNQDLDES